MKPTPLLLALLLAVPASAGWRDVDSSDFKLAAPPAKGSAAYKADFDELLRWQAARTSEQCALATAQEHPGLDSFYGGAGLLTDKEIEKAKPLFSQILSQVSKVSKPFKLKFLRPRPWLSDPRVQPCAPKPSSMTSYPSTHAMAGDVFACSLAAMYPERAAKLEARGRLAGDLRVIAGVHHPSDVAASRLLAAGICEKFLADPGFQKELAAAK